MLIELSPIRTSTQDKSLLRDQETIVDDTAAQAHVENYGSRLFEVADSEDRSGNASLRTVKTYLAASQLFESLAVFGEISEEISERTKYSKFRAATIMKAVKAGEKPPLPENIDPLDQLPIPPAFAETPPGQEDASTSSKDDGPSQLKFPPPTSAMPAAPSDGYQNAKCSSSEAQVSPQSVEKAIKLCKYASSALMLHDVQAAIENLQDALALLQVQRVSE